MYVFHLPPSDQVLVTLNEHVTVELRDSLTKATGGVESVGFLPDRTLLFFITDLSSLLNLAAVKGVVRSL